MFVNSEARSMKVISSIKLRPKISVMRNADSDPPKQALGKNTRSDPAKSFRHSNQLSIKSNKIIKSHDSCEK